MTCCKSVAYTGVGEMKTQIPRETFCLQWDRFCLNLGTRTLIMGILNLTPDSFSDGGRFSSLEAGIAQGRKLADLGADILDIGGESTRPFSQYISAEQEMERVLPVIKALCPELSIPISIDTWKSEVARAALDAGASMINDISAFENDPEMADLAAETQVPVILMHKKGNPETMQEDPDYDHVVADVYEYLQQRAEFAMKKGIRKDRIILDPGIGFGKTLEHNLSLMKHLDVLAAAGFPILMGASRKACIREVLGKDMEEPLAPDHEITEYGTLATAAASIYGGAHIIRVHDVYKARSFIRMLDAIQNAD